MGLRNMNYIYGMTKRGKAYLTIEIETKGLEEAQVLEVKNILTDVKGQCQVANNFQAEKRLTIRSQVQIWDF